MDTAGSDIICLKVFSTHIIVTNTLAASLDLLEKRSLTYSDRYVSSPIYFIDYDLEFIEHHRPYMTMLNDL